MKSLCLVMGILCLQVSTFGQTNYSYVPEGLSGEVYNTLQKASKYMDRSEYDSAGYAISNTLFRSSKPLSQTDQFYLYSYESEIMYYNALFEQGLNMAMRAHDIADSLANDTLHGSAENLLGLFYMNLGNYNEAIGHFKTAITLLPFDHPNDYLAFQYHAFANLGECYIRSNVADSAIHYSALSIPEASKKNRVRGVTLARWNIAEAHLMKNEVYKAIELAEKALETVRPSKHRDVVQILCATLMKCHLKLRNEEKVFYWMEQGLKEQEDELNTDLSRLEFLNHAVKACIELKEIDLGAQMLNKLNLLEREVSNKQQKQRINILEEYYEKNQNLMYAKGVAQTQANELKLRKMIEWILIVLAIASIMLIFFFYRNFRQKQRISELHHLREMNDMQKDLELKSLKARMQALFDERNRIASDLHDDIGAALSSIRIYSGAAQKQMDSNPQEGLNLIQKINESSTNMMERMSDIVWSINPKHDSGESLVLRMKTFSSEVLGTMNIKLNYSIDPEIENLRPTLIARRNIYLIFKEAINNIAKYSEATTVDISLSLTHDFFKMMISDNGKGFNVTQAFSGNGMNNMSLRAKNLNGYFHVSSHAASGTTIEFKIDIATISERDLL